MTERGRQEALLEQYQEALARNPAAAPPAGLDPEFVALAQLLARTLRAPAPDRAFVEGLGRQLFGPGAARPPATSGLARNGRAPAASGGWPALGRPASGPARPGPAPGHGSVLRTALLWGANGMAVGVLLVVLVFGAALVTRRQPQGPVNPTQGQAAQASVAVSPALTVPAPIVSTPDAAGSPTPDALSPTATAADSDDEESSPPSVVDSPTPAPASPTPRATVTLPEAVLTLTPDSGPCGTPVTVEGIGYPAGETIDFSVKVGNSDNIGRLPSVTAGADGTFVTTLDLRTAGCNDQTPDGTPFAIFTTVGNLKAGQQIASLGRATFTVSSPPSAIVTPSRPVPTATPMAASPSPMATAAITSQPVLTLTPDSGPCNTQIRVRGAGFPARKQINFTIKVGDSDTLHTMYGPVVLDDGTFSGAGLEPRAQGWCDDRTPDGTTLTLSAVTGNAPAGEQGEILAQATFTVSSPAGATAALSPTPRPESGEPFNPAARYDLGQVRYIYVKGATIPGGVTYIEDQEQVRAIVTALDGTVTTGAPVDGLPAGERFVIGFAYDDRSVEPSRPYTVFEYHRATNTLFIQNSAGPRTSTWQPVPVPASFAQTLGLD